MPINVGAITPEYQGIKESTPLLLLKQAVNSFWLTNTHWSNFSQSSSMVSIRISGSVTAGNSDLINSLALKCSGAGKGIFTHRSKVSEICYSNMVQENEIGRYCIV